MGTNLFKVQLNLRNHPRHFATHPTPTALTSSDGKAASRALAGSSSEAIIKPSACSDSEASAARLKISVSNDPHHSLANQKKVSSENIKTAQSKLGAGKLWGSCWGLFKHTGRSIFRQTILRPCFCTFDGRALGWRIRSSWTFHSRCRPFCHHAQLGMKRRGLKIKRGAAFPSPEQHGQRWPSLKHCSRSITKHHKTSNQ